MSFTWSHDELCREIVESSPIAIILSDREGRVRLWNRGAQAMFGWSAAETLGHSMEIIVPEKHRARHWDAYYRVMETGITKYGRDVLAVPALTKDGRRISIEFNVALLKDPDGNVVGAAATIQDVTARWERDKALRERLALLDAQVKQLGGPGADT